MRDDETTMSHTMSLSECVMLTIVIGNWETLSCSGTEPFAWYLNERSFLPPFPSRTNPN